MKSWLSELLESEEGQLVTLPYCDIVNKAPAKRLQLAGNTN